MDVDEREENTITARNLLEDERLRTRGGFAPPPRTQESPFIPQTRTWLPTPDPGMGGQQRLSAESLKCLRENLPFLASFPDDYLNSQSIDSLIKANMVARQAESQSSGKSLESRLNQNFVRAAANPVELTGSDNRSSVLHPARFLGGAGISVTTMWLEARKVLGPSGVVAISNYDMGSLGCSGCVTAKGWETLHNPGSSDMTLKLFTVANVSHVASGSKTVTLAGEEGVTISENLKSIAEMGELKMALRTLREAASLAVPWNKSYSVLEGFFITHDFMSSELEGKKKAAALAAFTDHVLKLNAAAWIQETKFLAGGDLEAAWNSWWGARKFCYDGQDEDQPMKDKGSAPRSSSNFSRRPGSQQGPQGRQYSGPAPDWTNGSNFCGRYNSGNCPNKHGECFVPGTGTKLFHLCTVDITKNGQKRKCGKKHTKSEHK